MATTRSITLLVACAWLFAVSTSTVGAFTLMLSSNDFGKTNVFSTVNTFAFEIDIADPFQAGLFADPTITNIQYSVSGSLDPTPSGFPAFGFQLDHIFPSSPPITGAQFYGLNASAVAGQTLRFEISASADLSNGLQIDELMDLGGGVVFRLNAREEGTGRYHPAIIELMSDGTGRIQNSNNQGGVNPATMQVVNLDFGDEYITDLTFNPATFTIGVPEPARGVLLSLALAATALRRRRA